MKHITLTKQDYEILQKLQNQTAKRIIVDDGGHIIFHYGSWHIFAAPRDFKAASQNRFDEAIGVRCIEESSYYDMRKYDRILCKLKPVERIWIVRTFLYFSDHVTFENNSDQLSLPSENPLSKADKARINFLNKVSGAHEEIVCHPLSREAEEANDEFSNLVDVGFVFQIDGNLIRCFSPENAFSLSGRILTQTELKEEVLPLYQLIEFDSN